ncbi:MAG: hypothetical protein CBC35_03180 [Planctomycetes bacterium TMED75]|nr:hypothetical protein [Planctomycetaceae bacterium]OUU94902.1 MAG: hypothetical protein CBC35_03180 [Planctomycetes bacterium TMED75]
MRASLLAFLRLSCVASLGVSCLLLIGCATDPSKLDEKKSYFDGGSLRSPEPTTIVLTGRVLKSQGRVDEAEYVLRRVIADHPKFPPGYAELAELLLKDSRTNEAIILLQRGVVEVPTSALLRNDLGMCFVVTEDFSAAADEFTRARELDRGDAAFTANLAMVRALQGHYDESVRLYSEVIPVAEAHGNVAVLAEARGDLERAESDRAIASNIMK